VLLDFSIFYSSTTKKKKKRTSRKFNFIWIIGFFKWQLRENYSCECKFCWFTFFISIFSVLSCLPESTWYWSMLWLSDMS